jgi:hypothetical protein
MSGLFDDQQTLRIIGRAVAEMRSNVSKVLADDIDWDEFDSRMFKLMRSTYEETAQNAVGGALSKEQKRLIESALAEQLYPHGEGFSLTERLQDGRNGTMPINQFTQSLSMYLRSSRSSAMAAWANDKGDVLAVRRLGATDHHCARCLLYAGLGAIKIQDAIIPGRACSCYSNCVCTLEIVEGN